MPHPIPSTDQSPIDRLREIMHILRAPGGCPWDAEQTHETLAPHLIEEAYEVAAAIKGGNRDELVDELGDVLLQPIFHAEVASETGAFDFDDIATAICEKLIRRHPHVFGDSVVDDPDAVITQWEKIKAEEKGGESDPAPTVKSTILKNANDGLPSLMAAQKIQKKVGKVGFDWPDLAPVMDKIREETAEVAEALESGNKEHIAEEIGDLLFAVVNIARKTDNNAEMLLDAANRKFVDRFHKVEVALTAAGQSLEDASLDEMDAAWNAAKNSK